jgi:hypothetical protein
MREKYSISHFGLSLAVFQRLIEFYPKGEYRDLGGTCVVFKMEHSNDFSESWFIDDAHIGEWREEE